MSPTTHAVMPPDSFRGSGNVPAATLRHSVAADIGKIAKLPGALLRGKTSWFTRKNVLSGNESNAVLVTGMGAVCAALIDVDTKLLLLIPTATCCGK